MSGPASYLKMHGMKNTLFLLLVMATGVAKGQAGIGRQQWDAVEGIYQLVGNPNMFIRFTDRDRELVARFLWDATAEVHFLPDSGLVFERKDEVRVHIRFATNGEGRVVHVTMGNGTEWDRVSGLVLTAGKLKVLAGSYQSIDDSDNRIIVKPGDNALLVTEAWSGRQVVLTPLSDTFFFSAKPEYTLQFLTSEKGGTPEALKVMGRYTFLLTGK